MFQMINQNMPTVVVILLAVFIAIYFALYGLSWINFWYEFPFVGKLARLSRDSSLYSSNNSWTNSERTLCKDYSRFVLVEDQAEFNKHVDYLRKTDGLERKPLPAWMPLLLVSLATIEGLGFSSQLGPWLTVVV
jgi:hypothetical protein